jgi:acyl-coenzyme A thioesterase 9
MRSAFELAQASGQLFAQSDIKLSSFDDVVFKNPVELGSLLKMKAQVVRSGGASNNMFQVRVLTETVDMHKGFTSEANAYCFTFKSNKQLRKVVPKTYAESMSFIEGKKELKI